MFFSKKYIKTIYENQDIQNHNVQNQDITQYIIQRQEIITGFINIYCVIWFFCLAICIMYFTTNYPYNQSIKKYNSFEYNLRQFLYSPKLITDEESDNALSNSNQ